MSQKNEPNEIINKCNAKDKKGNTAEMLSWTDHEDRWQGGGKTEKNKGKMIYMGILQVNGVEQQT